MKWSNRRLQLALLLSPAAAGAAAEMVEVAGGVEAEERTYRWVSVWRMEEGSLVLRRGVMLAEGRRRAGSRFVREEKMCGYDLEREM